MDKIDWTEVKPIEPDIDWSEVKTLPPITNQPEELVPIEKVIDDMYSDKSGVAGAARDYYKEHYASKEEKETMELEEKLDLILDCLFLFSPVIVLLLVTIIKSLS